MAKAVLIVDDNAFIRQALCEIFERESDFQVCGEAENGKEAIEKAWELHPDLIVLDLSMPVMNGLDAAKVLKCLMPTVPLIMYSAFGRQFRKAGNPSCRHLRTGFQVRIFRRFSEESTRRALSEGCLRLQSL